MVQTCRCIVRGQEVVTFVGAWPGCAFCGAGVRPYARNIYEERTAPNRSAHITAASWHTEDNLSVSVSASRPCPCPCLCPCPCPCPLPFLGLCPWLCLRPCPCPWVPLGSLWPLFSCFPLGGLLVGSVVCLGCRGPLVPPWVPLWGFVFVWDLRFGCVLYIYIFHLESNSFELLRNVLYIILYVVCFVYLHLFVLYI